MCNTGFIYRDVVSGVKSWGLEATEKTESILSKRKEPRKQGKNVADSRNKASVAQK